MTRPSPVRVALNDDGGLPAVNPIVAAAFCVFAFSIPIEYPTTLPTQIHTVTAVVFLTTTLLQPALCWRRPSAAVWWQGAYLWVYLAICLFSEHATDTLKLFSHSLLVALLLWVGGNVMRDVRIARAALISFVLGCAALALVELVGSGLSAVHPGEGARATVFGQDANFIGGNMAMALVAILGLVSAVRNPGTIGFAAAAVVGGLIANSLVAAGSRGAFAGMAAGLLAFAIAGSTRRAAIKHISVALLAAGVLVWVGSRFEPTRDRVATTFATGDMSGRERIYPEAWQMVVERPVLGWGPVDGRYELRLRTAVWEIDHVRESPLERDAHNLVLESLMASGLAGTIPLLICIALCVWAAWQGRTGPHGAAAFALIATVLVLSMSTNWSVSKEAWLFFGYGLASRRSALG